MTKTTMLIIVAILVAISVYLAYLDWCVIAARLREGPRVWLARLWRFITTPAGAAIGLLIVGLMVAPFHFYLAQDWSLKGFIGDFYANFSVEFISIAITVLIIDRLYQYRQREQERQRNIQRWREEIEDYLGWDEKEATYRIVGNIKRLNREGVTDIWLREAYLQKADLRGADLRGANLVTANLFRADLRGANLSETNLVLANLEKANLVGANLVAANLERANLVGADLRGANLSEIRYNSKPYDEFGTTHQPTRWPTDFDPVAAGAIDVSKEGD